MSTAGDIRTNNFDILRLVAASQVVFEHGLEHFLGTARLPWWDWILLAVPGVPIFFLVSGFLISLSFERSANLLVYLQNRFLRIYPALWLCFGISLLLVVVLGQVEWGAVSPGRIGVWVAAQLTIGQFYNAPWLRSYGSGVFNGSLWTIPVELQFYLMVPVLYRLLGLTAATRRNGPLIALLIGFWGLGFLFNVNRVTLGDVLWFKLLGVTFIPYFYLFLLGVLTQRNWHRLAPLVAGRWVWWTLVYIVVAWGLHAGGLVVGTNWPNPLGVLPLAGLVFSLAYSAPTLADRLLSRNDISYGVYIYHMPIINAFLQLGYTGSAIFIAPVAVITTTLAALSWRLLERPALQLKRRTVHAVQV